MLRVFSKYILTIASRGKLVTDKVFFGTLSPSGDFGELLSFLLQEKNIILIIIAIVVNCFMKIVG
ncbi:hypothetical protein C7S20_18455 [Christiangramia fulva]|uniref:Uncharacterized protein n=1 Tax=Christiangramia fulva TaxID=2126553 RepID=A0A2R3Z9Y4_9FLAO|nr:hypothetical protein C7S20_18455 [Christiangramia fulva]